MYSNPARNCIKSWYALVLLVLHFLHAGYAASPLNDSGYCQPSQSGAAMLCSNRGIEKIPKFNESVRFTGLNLEGNRIAVLRNADYKGLHFLKRLYLGRNVIGAIQEGTFEPLSQLTHLELDSNNITVLHAGMFSGLTSLEILRISRNVIGAIQEGTFEPLSQLTHLYLDSNNITVLHAGMFSGLTSSRFLRISRNVIGAIQEGTFEPLSQLDYLDLDSNNLTALHAGMFSGLTSLGFLNISKNVIGAVQEGTFEPLSRLAHLDLDSNNLTALHAGMFSGLTPLGLLRISRNVIGAIQEGTFEPLSHLTHLYLDSNNLTALHAGMFSGLTSSRFLDLRENGITSIEPGSFKGLETLKRLKLDDNELTVLGAGVFQGLSRVETLSLQRNNIASIEAGTFKELHNLLLLDLRNNKVTELSADTFSGLASLGYLYLSNNTIATLADWAFRDLGKIWIIDLRFNNIGKTEPSAFDGLHSYGMLYSDDWRLCCLANSSEVLCGSLDHDSPIGLFPRSSPFGYLVFRQYGTPFSSCDDLLHDVSLRLSIWIIGTFSTCFNAAAIVWRLLSRYRSRGRHSLQPQQKTTLLTICLAFGDFCMGIFLLIIGAADAHFRGYYILQDENWRNSFACPLAGFLSTFSSEFSVFILTLITVDRCLVIVYGVNRGLSYPRTKTIAIGLLIASAVLAAIPLTNSSLSDFYNQTGVCLALPFSIANTDGTNSTVLQDSRSPSWIYSFSIFIGFNTISVLIIIVCYVRIFLTAAESRRQTRNTANDRETRLGRRILLIVGTDMACWVPIIILGFMSAFGHQLPPTTYAWIAVFGLPINSAINPLIYTFYTEAFQKAIGKKWSKTRDAFQMMSRYFRQSSNQDIPAETIEMQEF